MATATAPRIAAPARTGAGASLVRRLLARVVNITPIAAGAAAGLIAVGALALAGGIYANHVVHDQLAPQKITFAPANSPTLPADIKQYAGKPVLDGATAKVFADKYIAVHLEKIGHGQTYAQVSAKSLANPKDQALAAEAQTLFRGETLRGLLLNAWGWSMVGTLATAAGIVLLVLGSILFLLPVGNWWLNERGRPATAS